jgi:hypothetical protein
LPKAARSWHRQIRERQSWVEDGWLLYKLSRKRFNCLILGSTKFASLSVAVSKPRVGHVNEIC